MTTHLVTLGVLSFALACSKSTPPPARPMPAAAKPLPPSDSIAAPSAVTTAKHLGVDDTLAAQCKFQLSQDPTFSHDEFDLDPRDRQLLDQLATCLLEGPLRGKALSLVGHADPRGTDEYNLGLGDRRASRVRDYLVRLGVAASQLSATTRGELDARGSDEATWSDDRRVDITLQ